jgi:glutamyl-tRNA reductase
MNLLSIGISHHTASVDIRERMWFTEEETRAALQSLQERLFAECLVVSTCNRTEVYGITLGAQVDEGALKDLVIDMKGARGAVSRDHFVGRLSGAAVHQLFKVASGADSMIIGDVQILNQIKEAFALSQEMNAVGPVLHRLMQSTLHVGKRVRTETSIVEGAVSVSYAAVELAGKIFADLSKKSALLVGAGETGELTLKHLVGRGIGSVRIANRTREKAEALVASFGGTVVDFERLAEAVQGVDIVITSVSSPSFILEPADLQKIMRARGNSPLFVIDIGVPRNVNPAAKKIENVFLYDIDALSAIVDRNLEARHSEIPRVNAIIEEELAAFFAWYNTLQVGPTIHELRESLERIRHSEVEKNINRFKAEDRELVELLTRRIVNKILHEPMTVLKRGAENGSGDRETVQRIKALRDLFGIPGGSGE